MKRCLYVLIGLSLCSILFAQSPSFQTYMNPVIPGDHPDPTLTMIGHDFYTSGSSFNPTPKIYHSTDLVHWEVIAQPVSASWSVYGDEPGGGIWGGHMVLYHEILWHYFGRGGGRMYFVTAQRPEGPWSSPTLVQIPDGMPNGLGVDNSIFIDEETGKWYMLTKAGQENNHIIELGDDGQPTGVILDLTWLNPDAEGNPYSWAEGPVMWKHDGYYYYSFAQHLVGQQYVMRSETLTDDEADWTIFEGTIFTGTAKTYNRPNHISPVVELEDGTSWTIAHSYHASGSWYAHGRQGLLCEVTYDDDWPVIEYPPAVPVDAPQLPSSSIPWAVARSDMFNTSELNPAWSHLGYTPDASYSLTDREGWLHLEPYQGSNTVIQNDGEHYYTLITQVDFEPESATDQAGLWIINGPETLQAKVFSTVNAEGKNVIAFSFEDTSYEIENTVGSTVWLKLARVEHEMSGFFSADGVTWTQIGEAIDATPIDINQTQFNDFTGNQQGLFVNGKEAYFDLYVYKDAYTPISADSPANQVGTSRKNTSQGYALSNLEANDWSMYAGVEFGNADYNKVPALIKVTASSTTTGSHVEVWLDSLDTGDKIADCLIDDTGSLNTYQTFTANVEPITGQHDVYLKYTGTESGKLLQILSFYFVAEGDTTVAVPESSNQMIPKRFSLQQNYPNPFNPSTQIRFEVPRKSFVSLKVSDLLGREIAELAGKNYSKGVHSVTFDASQLATGLYFYTLRTGDFNETRKMFLIR